MACHHGCVGEGTFVSRVTVYVTSCTILVKSLLDLVEQKSQSQCSRREGIHCLVWFPM